MSPEYEHILPNGETLVTVDIATAQEYLARLVAAFDAGTQDEPMIIGDDTKPMAVVLPIKQWLGLLDIAEEVAADEQLADEVRASLADPGPPVTYEEFLKTVYDPRHPRGNSSDNDQSNG